MTIGKVNFENTYPLKIFVFMSINIIIYKSFYFKGPYYEPVAPIMSLYSSIVS